MGPVEKDHHRDILLRYILRCSLAQILKQRRARYHLDLDSAQEDLDTSHPGLNLNFHQAIAVYHPRPQLASSAYTYV